MSAYQLTADGVRRLADGAIIPPDEGNRDWREYQDWVAEGSQPEPAPVQPVIIPSVVPAGDFVVALHQLGWIDDVKAAVAQAGAMAEDLWMHASTFERGHPMLLQVAQAIGKTSDDLDRLFLTAKAVGGQ